MPLVTTEAVVLQTFPYSETSKVLRLLTRTHGVQSAMARGARRPRSRFGGVLEPFTEGLATFYLKRGRDLHTLSGFELVRTRQQLGRDLVRFGSASLIAELVIRTGSEEAEPGLYEQVRDGLDRLAGAPEDQIGARALAEAWALIARLGFAPAVQHCVICSVHVREDADAFFDYAAGGVHCTDCGSDAPGRQLPAAARRDMVLLCQGRIPATLDRAAAHWQLLARFLAYHVTDIGSLRSLRFLADTVEAT